MIKLAKWKLNTIEVKVVSLVAVDGFTATLSLNGDTKAITDLGKRNISFDFSIEDVAKLGSRGAEGLLSVFDNNGKSASKQRIWFKPVNTVGETLGFKTIYVMVTGDYGGGGGDGEGFVKKINGKSPNQEGSITLTPSDLGIGYNVDIDDEKLTLFLD